MRLSLAHWTVDYGDGPRPVEVPHAWRQDVPVSWEGPAVYRTTVDVPAGPHSLVFHGVSYAATVSANGRVIGQHRGIWDAFTVSLADLGGQRVEIAVEVVKNGGAAYPVRDVASGFIPYVFNTFGGIYQPVELVDEVAPPPSAPPCRTSVQGRKIFVAGKPFYVRGALTWGWYPELGHTNPDEATIRREIHQAQQLGFNLIKFCLWVPPHRYLEIMREVGMEAWLELPLWNPSPVPEDLEEIAGEIERIVEQYRRHDNIVVWTVGCELSAATPPEYRQRLVSMVKRHTGSPLVKDNSGGAEMYGGDLREFGDFYDFHPYCDSEFYPVVLDALLPGPRAAQPVLLGEYNDIDVHRDLARIRREAPYWTRDDDAVNPQGVRWQFDIPRFLKETRFAQPGSHGEHLHLMRESNAQAVAIRKFVHESVRSRDAIGGYVVTGWRDTPISTAGVVDDWGELRFTPSEFRTWNFADVLYLIPTRRPTWIGGGNRPGWLNPWVHFAGAVLWKVGLSSESGREGSLAWRVVDEAGTVVASGRGEHKAVPALESHQVGELYWPDAAPGSYDLEVRMGKVRNQWPIWVVPRPDWGSMGGWNVDDPAGLLDGLTLQPGPSVLATRLNRALGPGTKGIFFLNAECTKPGPFWRESAYEFLNDEFWTQLGFRNRWSRLFAVSGDRTLDIDALKAELPADAQIETLLNRIDVRTYSEAPIMVRVRAGGAESILTTLRPFGGLGAQPSGIRSNPAGCALLAGLMRALVRSSG